MTTITGKPIGPIGLGLMSFTWRPTITPDADAFSTLRTALSLGANHWNGGEFYGPSDDRTIGLSLLARYFTAYPEDATKVVLSVKGGMDFSQPPHFIPRGDPDAVRKSVDNVLRLLDGKKFLDVFECARVDRSVPIEVTVSVLAEYVKAGKIGGIGLSEAGPETIRRAQAVHPIAAVEVEISLWSMEALAPGGIIDVCAELGIPVVAYSPLGKGFLTGGIKSRADLLEGDIRLHFDRFSEENFEKNLQLAREVKKVAEKVGCSPAQLCLAWVRSKGRGKTPVVPIPGTVSPEKVRENCTEVLVSDDDLEEVEKVLSRIGVIGGRYTEAAESSLLV